MSEVPKISREQRADVALSAAEITNDFINFFENVPIVVAALNLFVKKWRSKLSVATGEKLVEAFTQAKYDPLTGLQNRRKGLEVLDLECQRAYRYGRPLTVAFLDLNNFKDGVNDKHGHKKGDQCLVDTSQRLEKALRDTDTVFRYGGDEFVVIFTETEADDLIVSQDSEDSLIMRIVKAVEESTFKDGAVCSVGVSVGITQHFEGDTPESMLNRADTLMYLIKPKAGMIGEKSSYEIG